MTAPESAPRRLRRFPLFRVGTLLFLLVPAALLAAFFFRPLIENERFAYRDVGYFYYPLFEQIQREWERGRLPLWDPFENLGQPLAGNPTSSVFYPGKAIFFLSSAGCVDFNACFSLYIIGHVALSFFGVYFLTRRLRISRAGAVLAGLSYSFSGPILFQYSNVVFLVGAAWLPFLALFSFDFFASATVAGKLKSTLKLSVAQALAILGGEPQIVYLSTLAFFAFALVAPVRLAVKTAPSPPKNLASPNSSTVPKPLSSSPNVPSASVRRVRDRFRTRFALGLLLVGVASTATFLLAAPQILPSAELIARSERAAGGAPRSLWEIPAALWESKAKNNAVDATAAKARLSKKTQNSEKTQNKEDAPTKETTPNAQNSETSFYASLLGGEIENNGRNRATYRFSVGPWRWAERLFPNVGGRQFPRSSRWFAIFPEEISVWTPTLYCGVVPYLFAVAAARFRVGGARRSQRRSRRRQHRFFQRKIAELAADSPQTVAATAKLPLFPRRDRSTLDVFRVWATWLVVVSTAAALGGFGVVWAVRFTTALLSGAQPAQTFVDGDPVGGLYWLFNLTLPKFVEFRYPAKLLTLSALGLAVLTGFGWDERRFSRRFFILGGGVGALSAVAFLVLSACGDGVFSTLRAVDPLHGPVRPRLAFESVRGAFGQTALVLAATLLLLAFERRVFQTKTDKLNKIGSQTSPLIRSGGVAFAVLAISALDLYAANAWTIATAPRSFFESRSEISRIVEAERAARLASQLADVSPLPQSAQSAQSAQPSQSNVVLPLNSPRSADFNADLAAAVRFDAPPLRVYRFPVWFPAAFPTRSSSDRISERVVWDAATLFPKLPFSRGIATIDARGTAMEAEYAAFIDAFPLGFNRDADAAFLDVAFFLGPPEITARLAVPTVPTVPTDANDANNANSTSSGEFSAVNVDLRRVLAPSSRVWIFRDGRPAPLSDERAEIVVYEPNRIVYFVELTAPADLVFAEQYWPDWEGRAYPLADQADAATLLNARFDADAASAFLETRRDAAFDAPLEPTFRFLRQTSLPAGTYCFVATYRPRRLFVGAILGAVAWSGVLGGAGRLAWKRRRRQTTRKK